MSVPKAMSRDGLVSDIPFLNTKEKLLWWATVPLNPFRLFFPIGILFGLIGVGHWVLWSVGWKIPAIALAHAALQTQGFLASFVIGFLMTAFPRFTGTWPANKTEILITLVASLSVLISILQHSWLAAQLFYLVLISNLIIFAGRRVPYRNKALPPSFLLMGFGFLHAILGPLLIFASRFGTTNYPLFSAGRQMIQVGFLLCMILGVTGKLAPFLLGYTDDPERDVDGKIGFRTGKKAVVLHGLTGAGLLASFFIDNLSPKVGAGLRAIIVTLHLLAFARIARPLKKRTTVMFFFHVSCWMIPLGLWTGFFCPQFRIAALHIVFLGGFSLMIFSFGMLIVLSHSRKAALLNSRMIPLKVIGGFVLMALVFRLLAEIVSSKYMLLIHLASGLWVVAALIWAGVTFPKIFDGFNADHLRRSI